MARRIHCGINIDPANPDGRPSVQELRELGTTWVRFTFKDASDAPDPTGFEVYDDVVRELNQAGINILMILTYDTYPGMPEHDASDAVWSDYVAKFTDRCRQIAQHYGTQVQAYQIWNEPDLLEPSPDYDPRVRPEVFADLLKAAFTGIKEVSSATVVTGGLAAGHPAYLEQVTGFSGGVLYADAVGVHPYGRRPSPDWPTPNWGFGVLGDLIRQYHTAAGKPIWISEIGTDDIPNQGSFPERAFEALNEDLATASPYVFWFCWSDGMVPPFGLLDADAGKKSSYTSFREFAARPLVGKPVGGVIERLSAHSSDRGGHQVRYIIVHSSVSPVAAPAENTLKYLLNNDRQVSSHELVLPGDQVYRLVPDERAAHHCASSSVQFPDGTPSALANQITWGIEAYQITGKPVGEAVLTATIQRVVAACRRFGLDASRVLGHREIDPSRRSDPVGVDMDDLRSQVTQALTGNAFLVEAERHQVIQFNPNAALQSHIFADGFVPNSPEFDIEVDDVAYRAQRAEQLESGRVRVYYAVIGDWDNVRFVERG